MQLLKNLFKKWLLQQKQQKLNRILNNNANAIGYFQKKEAVYYEMYKTYWEDLQVLIDRILFVNLWTTSDYDNAAKYGFEQGLEELMTLLSKNAEELDAQKEEARDVREKPWWYL